MSSRTLQLSEELSTYLRSVAVREHPVMAKLREETLKVEYSMMQITPEQGAFMGLLVELLGVRKALEIGVYTGYSSLAVALALPANGKLVACDVSDTYTAVARRYWREAGVEQKIDLRIAPALETLEGLLREGQANSFDLAFIDADKPNYENYYEKALQLVRPGGLIAIDNVLWGGAVADPKENSPSTTMIRALNRKIHADQRVSLCMVPIGDGLTLARRRA